MIKLTKRAASAPPPPPLATPGAASAAGPPPPPPPVAGLPFLEISALGGDVAVTHGVPLIGEPLRRSAVDAMEELVSASGRGVPYWLEVSPLLAAQLWGEVHSLRAVGPSLDLATMPASAPGVSRFAVPAAPPPSAFSWSNGFRSAATCTCTRRRTACGWAQSTGASPSPSPPASCARLPLFFDLIRLTPSPPGAARHAAAVARPLRAHARRPPRAGEAL